LAAPGANQPDFSLVAASGVATFRSGIHAGLLSAIIATLQGVAADAPVATVAMVVWDDASGNYPEADIAISAWASGIIAAGISPLINVYNIGGVVNTPPPLTGLQSFNLSCPCTPLTPWMFVQPTNQVVRAGSNATFFADAGPVWRYQWSFAGTDIPGATTSAYTLTNVQVFHAGAYSLTVSMPSAFPPSLLSSPALLTVLPSLVRPELRAGPAYGGWDGDRFQFTLLGQTNMVYRLQTSSDLVHWDDAGWVTNLDGSAPVIPPDGTAPGPRFYRAAQ